MPRPFITRILAASALTVALAGASSPAFATTATHVRTVPQTTTFAGKYKFFVTVSGHTQTCPIAIKSDGTAVAKCTGKTAHWTASGANITIVYRSSSITQTFKGAKTATGISSKAHPGKYSDTLGGKGTWYAVKM